MSKVKCFPERKGGFSIVSVETQKRGDPMYKILGTEIEDDKLLITVRNYHDHTTLLYYEEEINHIPDKQLKEYLQKRLPFIKTGNYG